MPKKKKIQEVKCGFCNKMFPKSSFKKSELKKNASKRRCLDCKDIKTVDNPSSGYHSHIHLFKKEFLPHSGSNNSILCLNFSSDYFLFIFKNERQMYSKVSFI